MFGIQRSLGRGIMRRYVGVENWKARFARVTKPYCHEMKDNETDDDPSCLTEIQSAPGDQLGSTSVAGSGSQPWLGRPFSSLRHRNYRLYFFGQLISQTGSWVQITALMWLAFELTQSNRWPAWIVGLHVFPTCLLGPWGGVLADRFPKRWLIFWMQACFMCLSVVLATIVLAGLVRPWHLLVLASVSGSVNALDFPARLSFVIEMVGRRDLVNAVGLNASLFNGARAVGPAIGGFLLLWLGPGWCFALNAVTYLGVLVGLARMDVKAAGPGLAAGGLRYVLEGFGYVLRHSRMAWLLALVAVIGFFGWPFLALLPAFAHDILGLEEGGYSTLLSATGFGALTAALTVATFGSMERPGWFVATGVFFFIIALMLLALSMVQHIAAAALCCSLVGFGLVLFFATCQSVVQLAAEDTNRGRVMGVWSMVVSGAQPLGNFLAGPTADRWSVPVTLRGQAFACGLALVGVLALIALSARQRNR
jgi:MFS family permease